MCKANAGRRRSLDCDYWDRLKEAEKAYLRRFWKEYYFGDFRERETPLHSVALQKDVVQRRNRERRDVLNVRSSGVREAKSKDKFARYYTAEDYAGIKEGGLREIEEALVQLIDEGK